MPQKIILGNAVDANAPHTKGWIAGHFISEGLCRTGSFEIKIWNYENVLEYGQKVWRGTEFIIVERGVLQIELDIPDGSGGFTPTSIVLNGKNREYVVIPPGCRKRIVLLETPSFGVTIRWPSKPEQQREIL